MNNNILKIKSNDDKLRVMRGHRIYIVEEDGIYHEDGRNTLGEFTYAEKYELEKMLMEHKNPPIKKED